MKLYRTDTGTYLETSAGFLNCELTWDQLSASDNLHKFLSEKIRIAGADAWLKSLPGKIVPPIGNQEVWASGVTYWRSRSARMEESKDSGGSTFYDKVYEAQRPELFFKAAPYRVVGHLDSVRIRRDSNWNVPEPELTLLLNPKGKLLGYTIGNDMSSRDIEGENPLYLPQAKSYNGSCSIGPCLYVTASPLPQQTEIFLSIYRDTLSVFEGTVNISQIRRSFEELQEYLFREISFPNGCYLMTGTGIVPPNDFTLQVGDEIQIQIDPIGTLINTVAS